MEGPVVKTMLISYRPQSVVNFTKKLLKMRERADIVNHCNMIFF